MYVIYIPLKQNQKCMAGKVLTLIHLIQHYNFWHVPAILKLVNDGNGNHKLVITVYLK